MAPVIFSESDIMLGENPFESSTNSWRAKEFTRVSSIAKFVGWTAMIVYGLFFVGIFLFLITVMIAALFFELEVANTVWLQFLIILVVSSCGCLLGHYSRLGNKTVLVVGTVLFGFAGASDILFIVLDGGNPIVFVRSFLTGVSFLSYLAATISQLMLVREAEYWVQETQPKINEFQSQQGSSPSISSMKIIALACQLSDDLLDRRAANAVEIAEEVFSRGFSKQLAAELEGILSNPEAENELAQCAPTVTLSSNTSLKQKVLLVVQRLLDDGSQSSEDFYNELVRLFSTEQSDL